jgi:hypothetical protein
MGSWARAMLNQSGAFSGGMGLERVGRGFSIVSETVGGTGSDGATGGCASCGMDVPTQPMPSRDGTLPVGFACPRAGGGCTESAPLPDEAGEGIHDVAYCLDWDPSKLPPP